MSATAAAIAGAATIAGAGIAASGQGKANKLGAKLTREGRAYDRQQWEDTNTYNSPAMQMQRLREAGLNPNLVYDKGATSVAALPPQAKIPEVRNTLASAANMNLAPMVSLYQDWLVKKQQIDNMKVQNDNMKADLVTKQLQQISTSIKNQIGTFDYSQKKRLADTQAAILGENLRQILLSMDAKRLEMDIKRQTLPYELGLKGAQMKNLGLDTKLKQIDLDYQSRLKPYGVSGNDNFFLRKIAPLFSVPSKDSGNRKAFWNSYFNNK